MASFLSAPRSDSAELDAQAARVHAVAKTFVGLVIVLMGTIVWVLPAYRARALVILGVSVASHFRSLYRSNR